MRFVYLRPSGEIHAQQIQGFLAAAGISSELRGESLRKTHGLTIDGLGMVEVVVSTDDEEQARALLASAELGTFRLDDDAQSGSEVAGVRMTVPRIRVALMVLLAAGFISQTSVGSRQQKPSRPNVLLIQADDLGYGDLSAYGQARFTTPSLDRLAREGIRFTEYYAGTTVCAPSRTALMTGLHTGHAWIRGNGDIPLRPEDVTIAEMLRDAGYRTAVIGKWGLGSPGSTGMPDRQGFDHAFGFLDHRHAHRQYTDHLWRNGERAATDLDKDYVNDLFTQETAAFIQRADARPFFVYLNYTVPHAELRAPEDAMTAVRGRFPEKPFENQKADAQAHRRQPRATHARVSFAAGAACGLRRDDYAHGSRHRTARRSSARARHRAQHPDDVRERQRSAPGGGRRSRVLQELRSVARHQARSLRRRHPRTDDRELAGHVFRPVVSAIIRGRTGTCCRRSATSRAQRSLQAIDGLSMARALRGETQPAHQFLYWEFHERGFQQAVRMGPWKAVRLKKDAPLELYNLAADPGEQSDVAAANPKIVAQIEEYLKTARTESERWPIK